MKGNMYGDSVRQWSAFVGCTYNCTYCVPSFQRQTKRIKCADCYEYAPHFHEERLKRPLPRTQGDEFIFTCSSGDIAHAKSKWIELILERIRELPNRTFLLQTKDPECFRLYELPSNVLVDITLETNRDIGYRKISEAPLPSTRYQAYLQVEHPRKLLTIEPILDFDLDIFSEWIRNIEPDRVYIGYDTKKCKLPEPSLGKTIELIRRMSYFTRVKLKQIRHAWWEESLFTLPYNTELNQYQFLQNSTTGELA